MGNFRPYALNMYPKMLPVNPPAKSSDCTHDESSSVISTVGLEVSLDVIPCAREIPNPNVIIFTIL